MMNKRVWILLLSAAALGLELLPFGAVLRFAVPEGSTANLRETYSYFDLTPFGYANFGPFLTAVLTCLLLAASGWLLWKGSTAAVRTVRLLSVASVILSLLPLMFGIGYYSVIGGGISLLLFATAVLSHQKDI